MLLTNQLIVTYGILTILSVPSSFFSIVGTGFPKILETFVQWDYLSAWLSKDVIIGSICRISYTLCFNIAGISLFCSVLSHIKAVLPTYDTSYERLSWFKSPINFYLLKTSIYLIQRRDYDHNWLNYLIVDDTSSNSGKSNKSA